MTEKIPIDSIRRLIKKVKAGKKIFELSLDKLDDFYGDLVMYNERVINKLHHGDELRNDMLKQAVIKYVHNDDTLVIQKDTDDLANELNINLDICSIYDIIECYVDNCIEQVCIKILIYVNEKEHTLYHKSPFANENPLKKHMISVIKKTRLYVEEIRQCIDNNQYSDYIRASALLLKTYSDNSIENMLYNNLCVLYHTIKYISSNAPYL